MKTKSISRSRTVVVLVFTVGLVLAGCSSSFSTEEMDYVANGPPAQEPVEDDEPSDAELDQWQQEAAEKYQQWSCSYDPTMNEDWHDDVLCQLGNQYDRPYLREWDDFVTQDELLESAAKYEEELNTGR